MFNAKPIDRIYIKLFDEDNFENVNYVYGRRAFARFVQFFFSTSTAAKTRFVTL